MNTRVGKQEDIIKAAIQAYNIHGSGFSTRDVAEICECSQSLVYSHYNTKRSLVEATFTYICTEIKWKIREVKFPTVINCDTVQDYFMKAWKKYFDYLTDDDLWAKTNFYFYCILNGYRYPTGYETPRKVLIKLIGDNYGALIRECPNAISTATYLMDIANGIAIGIYRGDFDDIEDYEEKIMKMAYLGISSMKTK